MSVLEDLLDYYRKDCYWCEESFWLESSRIAHLHWEHPRFFERYDELNGWLDPHKIPELPEHTDDIDSDHWDGLTGGEGDDA